MNTFFFSTFKDTRNNILEYYYPFTFSSIMKKNRKKTLYFKFVQFKGIIKMVEALKMLYTVKCTNHETIEL